MGTHSPSVYEEVNAISEDSEARDALLDYIRFPACRRLINRILTAQRDSGIKSIVVMSQLPGEGKTVFISALALGYMALLGKRVLIMDTVSQTQVKSLYHRGVLSGPRNGKEGANLGQGRIDLITTRSLSRLSLLHQPSSDDVTHALALRDEEGVYDSADFQVGPFVDSLKSSYDLILMDTCPLSEVGKDSFDPFILAQQADSCIVVASPESLERGKLSSLTRELSRYKISPLGIVVDTGIV